MYYYTPNIIIFILFVLFNPLYALPIAAVISIITKKISNLLIALLYVLSFSLMFSNQVFQMETDIGGYIEMYQMNKYYSYLDLIQKFLSNANGTEFLYFSLIKSIGELSSYSSESFILITYIIIFGLFSYLAFLHSQSTDFNFSLILFSTIFVTMVVWNSGYNLFRISIAASIVLIGIHSYFQLKSKIISRIIIYSSALFHLSTLPVIGIFEIYIFFIYRGNKGDLITFKNVTKIILYVSTIIFLAIYINNSIVYDGIRNIEIFSSGANKYSDSIAKTIEYSNYFRPIFLMYFAYMVYSWKNINHYELFILSLIVILEVLSHLEGGFGMLYAKAAFTSTIAMFFIAIKFLKYLPDKYLVLFIVAVFSSRIIILPTSSNSFFLERIALGELFNPFYGLMNSIFYYYDPVFEDFLWNKY
jgi:hypothetical protein